MLAIVAAAAFSWSPCVTAWRPQLRSWSPQQHVRAVPRMIEWPWDKAQTDDSYEPGKFMRHSELQPGCAPLGIVTAGLADDELEILAEALDYAITGPDGAISHVPIAVISESDLRLRLRDVLAKISERDSVLPERPCRRAGRSWGGASGVDRMTGSWTSRRGQAATRPQARNVASRRGCC